MKHDHKPTKPARSRVELLQEFYSSPPEAEFRQDVIAAVLGYSTAKLEKDRWRKSGLEFRRRGRAIYYVKADVLAWMNRFPRVSSTAQADEVQEG